MNHNFVFYWLLILSLFHAMFGHYVVSAIMLCTAVIIDALHDCKDALLEELKK